jgi:hypothetical protein
MKLAQAQESLIETEEDFLPESSRMVAADKQGALYALPARKPDELAERMARLKQRGAIRLGQALLELGLLDVANLEMARQIQQDDPSQQLGDVLRAAGMVDDEAVRAGLAYQLGAPAVDLKHWPFEPDIFMHLPADLSSPAASRRCTGTVPRCMSR